MKIKMNQNLVGIDGKIIPTADKPALTLKDVCIGSLLTPVQEDKEKEKFEKYEIYKKINTNDKEVELTIENLAVIKKVVGIFQPPLIMGQCFELLECN